MRALAVATALAAAMTLAPAVSSAADAAPYLPAPTGRQEVGASSLYLKDISRPDPWVPSVPYRELMVSLFYPAADTDGPTRQYMTPTESARYLATEEISDLPPDALSKVATNAVVDARPVGRPHSRPLVLLSPGFTNSRATLSSLAEDLASHGYVVAVIDHTYENRAMTFPDGRLTECAACEVDHQPGFGAKLVTGRAADASFVLDELTDPGTRSRAVKLIDPSRVAMAGHSAGGASAVPSMVGDARIQAGIDIDGSTHVEIPEPGLARPFLFLGSMDGYVPGEPSPYEDWERDWTQLTGWKRWLMVTGTVHPSFTDLGVFAGQLGIDLGASIDSERALDITRTYVRAFLDQHLGRRPQPLMSAPSPAYPEVTFIG
ncbi:alpha/beta hydrolase family protein [Actinophytocola sediminis]